MQQSHADSFALPARSDTDGRDMAFAHQEHATGVPDDDAVNESHVVKARCTLRELAQIKSRGPWSREDLLFDGHDLAHVSSTHLFDDNDGIRPWNGQGTRLAPMKQKRHD